MIPARMRPPLRVFLLTGAIVSAAALLVGCGTQTINGVHKSQSQLYRGAVLFSQRCAGCHTLSYAGTHGSAANIRTAQANNGPNFNTRCERPVDRVLYAIENGGFSGAIMPQNVVVGQDAIDVAEFVSNYAGMQAPHIPGVTPCNSPANPVGSINAAFTTPTTTTPSSKKAPSARSKHAASAANKRAASAARTAKNTQSRTHVSTP